MNISPITLPVFLQQYQQKTEKYTLKQPSLSDVFIRSSKPQNTSFSGNQPNQFTIDEFYISDTDNKTYQTYIEQKLEKPALPYAYNELPQVIGAKKNIFGEIEEVYNYNRDKLQKKAVYTGPYVPTPKDSSAPKINTEELKAEFKKTNSLDYTIPIAENSHYKPEYAPNAYITQSQEQYLNKTSNTDLTIRYGAVVNWSDSKIARDIMQNFYDGHNQTLEGTHINIQYDRTTKKYTVRIEGNGTYPYDFIQYIGKGTKFEDAKSAGGFGEGSKILACNLLARQDKKGKFSTDYVKYSSADWQITLSRSSDDLDSAIMQRTLEKVPEQNGNSIEFTTNNKELIYRIIDSLNWFESPYNEDFQNLDFDNGIFGLKLLGPGEQGNLYLTQRFEYEKTDNWDNSIRNADVIFRKKPDSSIFSVSRDRTYLNKYDIEKISENMVEEFSDDEILDLIIKLDSIWKSPKRDDAMTKITEALAQEASSRKIGIDFKDKKFVAVPKFTGEKDLEFLSLLGYTPVNSAMKYLVPTLEEINTTMSNHIPVEPTENEIKRMILLTEATKLIQSSTSKQIVLDTGRAFAKNIPPYSEEYIIKGNKEDLFFIRQLQQLKKDYVSSELFSEEDCEQPVFLFDKTQEGKLDNSVAQAITGYDKNLKTTKFYGHWIDRNYLNSGNFYKLLAIYLHEINHQHGDDGSSEFTYALTEELGIILSILSSQPETASKLNMLAQKFEQIPS